MQFNRGKFLKLFCCQIYTKEKIGYTDSGCYCNEKTAKRSLMIVTGSTIKEFTKVDYSNFEICTRWTSGTNYSDLSDD